MSQCALILSAESMALIHVYKLLTYLLTYLLTKVTTSE